MKKISVFIAITLMLILVTACSQPSPITQTPIKYNNVQVFSSTNKEGLITTKTIEASFDASGLSVAGNNNMNKPFHARFKKIHYKVYNLAMFINSELTFNLVKKYPKFAALTPLTMSIWEDKDANMNISTLTIYGMSRATGIPLDDPDLIAYNKLIKEALEKSMPHGHFKNLPAPKKDIHQSFAIDMITHADIEMDPLDYIDDFEAEFEAELEPLGFLFPNYTNLQEEIFDDYDYHAYDFFHTYSICKFDVIFPVSKLHPEAGAWAPCSFYLYKKKNDTQVHMGFLGVNNWIESLNIEDKASIKPLKEAEGMIVKVLEDMSE